MQSYSSMPGRSTELAHSRSRREQFKIAFLCPDARNRPSPTAFASGHQTGQNGYGMDPLIELMTTKPHLPLRNLHFPAHRQLVLKPPRRVEAHLRQHWQTGFLRLIRKLKQHSDDRSSSRQEESSRPQSKAAQEKDENSYSGGREPDSGCVEGSGVVWDFPDRGLKENWVRVSYRPSKAQAVA